jgi:DNA-binding MarR family transcriptional regulator
MEPKYKLLQEVVTLLEEYEAGTRERDPSVMGFSVWLNQRMGYFSPGMTHASQQAQGHSSDQTADQATMITMLITYLYRYAKHYTKKALESTPLSTLDEFGFLVTLLDRDSLTKSELINLHLLEITSGIEIIKRLTKQGLLETFPDPDDRRSRRVRLTQAGREVLFQTMQKMQKVTRLVAGDLSEEDQQLLLPPLNRLNDFHALIHTQDRKSDLDQIADRYLTDEHP